MALTKEAKELRNRYMREWRKKNPEKVRVIQERYLNKKAAAWKVEQERMKGEEDEH